MPDSQPDPTSIGGVPNAYRNALTWRWAPQLPRPLRGAFVKVLYALGSLADPQGRTKFRDGKPMKITQIARAACSDERDVRRCLTAGIAAGVIGTEQAPRRGRITVYTLLLAPHPNWPAAAAVLANSTRTRPQAPPPPWHPDGPADHTETHPAREHPADEFGGPTPEPAHAPPPPSSGDQPPFSTQGSSGDQPPLEFGGPTPVEFGVPAPEQPRSTQEDSQEMADVGPQPTVVREHHHHDDDRPPSAAPPEHGGEPPPLRPVPSPPPGARRGRGPSVPDGQAPLLLAVPPPPDFVRCVACHHRMIPRPGRTDRHAHCAQADDRQAERAERAARARLDAAAATDHDLIRREA